MSYITATTLEDALYALAAGPASVIAGGTDWFPAQGDHHFDGTLIDISRLAELRGVSRTDKGWRIGAATTWTDIIKADLPAAFDGLKLAAREVGSVQIQNTGTIAGNLCNASPAADGVPPLLTLNATVELSSTDGTRQMPISAFLQGVRKTDRAAHEILTAIHIPDLPAESKGSFVKLGARKYLVISICMVAVLVTIEAGLVSDIRIGIGAASPVAQRMTALEDALRGLPVTDLPDVVTDDLILGLTPISDVRASADYRQTAASHVIRRAIAQALEGAA
ncbi:FAD binding domain-containing protein [Roseobacter sp. GAI101]|uniref:FAD binding domain-containing protein n=1 Tax=Roseobacter sp. (strain GAI101) TaxID=391589 RepID=UPI0001871423|nr:xanthine dehydrogenase family protein subunit M [Roseobacter sp. GAI101]EEB82735.1 xanthine dehydrogenase FAD-binding subunit [Roseobacter sp. GAI101]